MNAEESYRLILDEHYPTFKNELLDEALYTALDALQKQIPKALFKTKETLRCPTCKRHITNTGQKKESIKYCCKCGQALDWDSVQVEEMEKYPNKYNLTPKSLKKLKILDWERLKQKTWINHAMTSGIWWCHLEGCQRENQRYDEDNEFWIGFNEDNNKIDFHFTTFSGLCGYNFDKFYDMKFIENKYDMQVQVNAIKWLNMMIDEKILGV